MRAYQVVGGVVAKTFNDFAGSGDVSDVVLKN
jgi:hypothetical protein